jgi:hypothetical protein
VKDAPETRSSRTDPEEEKERKDLAGDPEKRVRKTEEKAVRTGEVVRKEEEETGEKKEEEVKKEEEETGEKKEEEVKKEGAVRGEKERKEEAVRAGELNVEKTELPAKTIAVREGKIETVRTLAASKDLEEISKTVATDALPSTGPRSVLLSPQMTT